MKTLHHGKSVEKVDPPELRGGAEAMREAAAKVADDLLSLGGVAYQIREKIRALPLPEVTPDPRDAEIARLSAELEAARQALDAAEETLEDLRVPGGMATGFELDIPPTLVKIRAALAKLSFKCRYRISLPTGPQDCEWPHCGCDPAANRVIEHFQECGLTLVEEGALTEAREALEPFAEIAARYENTAFDAHGVKYAADARRAIAKIAATKGV